MKLNFLVLIFLGLLLSCNNKENKQTNAEDYYQFKVVDLSPYDLNATLFIPDETAGIGASFQTTIEH